MQYLDVFLSVVVSFFFCGNRGAPFQELSRRKIPFSIKTGFSVLIDQSKIGYVNRRKIPLVGPWPSTQVPNAEMNNLVTVKNVRAYLDENGTVQINLEDAARGLGFVESKGDYVRWQRVELYLSEFGFSTSGERPEFIPENIFYRLAMKAKNEGSDYGLLDINVENQIMGRPSINYWLTISFAKKGQTISHSS